MKGALLRASALAAATLATLAGLEVLLRILPAYGGARRTAVDERHPISRFAPDREFTWSRDWNFSIVNTVRVNNAGFVSDVDYAADAPGPLLAVIGDSYVEAAMVPFRRTCAGRLATMLEPDARVYAFGMAGAPLSQYLAWARHARDAYRPDGLLVIVVGNDYDESLLEYGGREGYHHFVEQDDGRLALEREDRVPSLGYRLARRSALVRYLAQNLSVRESFSRIRARVTGTDAPGFHLHAPASSQPARVADSQRAVDAFLDLLPGYAGLEPERIVLAVDGMRPRLYDDEMLDAAGGTFVDVMRRYFLAHARRGGYETIDLQPRFITRYRTHGRRFEWPRDGHWNALGHEVCFDAVRSSALLTGAFPAPSPAGMQGPGSESGTTSIPMFESWRDAWDVGGA